MWHGDDDSWHHSQNLWPQGHCVAVGASGIIHCSQQKLASIHIYLPCLNGINNSKLQLQSFLNHDIFFQFQLLCKCILPVSSVSQLFLLPNRLCSFPVVLRSLYTSSPYLPLFLFLLISGLPKNINIIYFPRFSCSPSLTHSHPCDWW